MMTNVTSPELHMTAQFSLCAADQAMHIFAHSHTPYPLAHSAKISQANYTYCNMVQPPMLQAESYFYEQENVNRCTPTRRNAGSVAKRKQN